MPRLRVVAGPSLDALEPITVNTGKAHDVSSPLFEGKILAYIKDFPDETGNAQSSEYFERPERKGVTWSIQVQGRFLNEVSANDVLFGNTFSRPLILPWGVGAAFKFMKYVDPTLEHDLGSKTKPWALSPLISTMPYLAHSRSNPPLFPPADHKSIEDNVEGSSGAAVKIPVGNSRARRTYFADEKHRKDVTFGPEDIITTDFAYGFLTFAPSPALNLPGGISFDLMRYWDGQPVCFVCCERKRQGEGDAPWGRVYWCVAIELVQDD
ncbi:DUF1769-domain-containing protein [Peniophora sp. CONT]|nr:DUF1769-domain-containing protein [Peniophora sp. CONT]